MTMAEEQLPKWVREIFRLKEEALKEKKKRSD